MCISSCSRMILSATVSGRPKNSAPSGPIRSSTAASDIGGQPRSLPILAEGLSVGRQELRSCSALIGEDIAVAVDSKRRFGVMFPYSRALR